MRPKSYKGETLNLHCNLGGTDSLFGETESYERETESLQSHLGETEIPIDRTELLGFGSGL